MICESACRTDIPSRAQQLSDILIKDVLVPYGLIKIWRGMRHCGALRESLQIDEGSMLDSVPFSDSCLVLCRGICAKPQRKRIAGW